MWTVAHARTTWLAFLHACRPSLPHPQQGWAKLHRHSKRSLKQNQKKFETLEFFKIRDPKTRNFSKFKTKSKEIRNAKRNSTPKKSKIFKIRNEISPSPDPQPHSLNHSPLLLCPPSISPPFPSSLTQHNRTNGILIPSLAAAIASSTAVAVAIGIGLAASRSASFAVAISRQNPDF